MEFDTEDDVRAYRQLCRAVYHHPKMIEALFEDLIWMMCNARARKYSAPSKELVRQNVRSCLKVLKKKAADELLSRTVRYIDGDE